MLNTFFHAFIHLYFIFLNFLSPGLDTTGDIVRSVPTVGVPPNDGVGVLSLTVLIDGLGVGGVLPRSGKSTGFSGTESSSFPEGKYVSTRMMVGFIVSLGVGTVGSSVSWT